MRKLKIDDLEDFALSQGFLKEVIGRSLYQRKFGESEIRYVDNIEEVFEDRIKLRNGIFITGNFNVEYFLGPDYED